jgi:hypothetical protein
VPYKVNISFTHPNFQCKRLTFRTHAFSTSSNVTGVTSNRIPFIFWRSSDWRVHQSHKGQRMQSIQHRFLGESMTILYIPKCQLKKISASIEHIIHQPIFNSFPIHIPTTSINTLVTGDAHTGEEGCKLSNALDLSYGIQHRFSRGICTVDECRYRWGLALKYTIDDIVLHGVKHVNDHAK